MLSESILDLLLATKRVAHPGRQLFPPFRFSQIPLFSCLSLLAWLISGSVHAEALQLSSSTDNASAGYFQLSWSWPAAPADVTYQLVERQLDQSGTVTTFNTIYQGYDLASVISGKPDGRYEYRVTAGSPTLADTVISNRVTVNVKHHSLGNAFAVLSLGVLIFLAIVISIYRGARNKD
jgi:hypothetical protein